MRASSYEQLKRYVQAIPDYNKVLELDKQNVIAYADRGLAELELGRYLAAAVDLQEAIQRKPDDSSIPGYLEGVSWSLSGILQGYRPGAHP
jgi:tetratricopeptide (TPR) repeat protein